VPARGCYHRGVNSLAPLPDTPVGRYRHYKGGEYEVMGVVRHSETLEPLVLYRPLYDQSGLWVRPHAMFFGSLEVDGQRRQRFERIA
jgi:hypothetical protein